MVSLDLRLELLPFGLLLIRILLLYLRRSIFLGTFFSDMVYSSTHNTAVRSGLRSIDRAQGRLRASPGLRQRRPEPDCSTPKIDHDNTCML